MTCKMGQISLSHTFISHKIHKLAWMGKEWEKSKKM